MSLGSVTFEFCSVETKACKLSILFTFDKNELS